MVYTIKHMHRTQLYIPQSLWKSVQNEAHTRQVTASELVRDVLAKYFIRDHQPVKKTEGILEFSKRINKQYPTHAPRDLATNLDHYMYGTPKKHPTIGL